MCFVITPDTMSLTKRFRARKRPIVAHKILRYYGEEENRTYLSIFVTGYVWEKGKIHKSERKSRKIQGDERASFTIHEGIHLYRQLIMPLAQNACAILCEINPQDIIAVNKDEIVAMKVKFVKILTKNS